MKRSVADAATKHAIGSSPASEETGKGGLPILVFEFTGAIERNTIASSASASKLAPTIT